MISHLKTYTFFYHNIKDMKILTSHWCFLFCELSLIHFLCPFTNCGPVSCSLFYRVIVKIKCYNP